MSVHHSNTVFGACLIATAMVVAAPICAAPSDFRLDVVEIGPNDSHATVHLSRVINGAPVADAIVQIDVVEGPQSAGTPTMTQHFIARPGSRSGDFQVIIEPGMQVFQLQILAEVAGEVEMIGNNIDVSQIPRLPGVNLP
jgi:hypothetical protein